MALLLARMLAEHGRYDSEEARKAYVFWVNSGPFDCGMTISSRLRGRPNPDTAQTSRGKTDRLRRIPAGFTLPALDGSGLHDHALARTAG